MWLCGGGFRREMAKSLCLRGLGTGKPRDCRQLTLPKDSCSAICFMYWSLKTAEDDTQHRADTNTHAHTHTHTLSHTHTYTQTQTQTQTGQKFSAKTKG